MQHNEDTSNPQEFYVWPSVTLAAQNAIDARYAYPLDPDIPRANYSVDAAIVYWTIFILHSIKLTSTGRLFSSHSGSNTRATRLRMLLISSSCTETLSLFPR